MKRKNYFTYIATNHTNSVLYTGVTNNLERRKYEHQKGVFESSFAKRYRIYKIVWFQEFVSIKEAIEAEKKIKGWRRSKKLELIKSVNPEFKDLLT